MRQVAASKNNLCMCIQMWCLLGVLFSSTFVFGTGLSPECKKEVEYDITNENNTFNCSTLCDSNDVSYRPDLCDTECAKCKKSIIDAQNAEAKCEQSKREQAKREQDKLEEAKSREAKLYNIVIILSIVIGILVILAIVVILLRNHINKCCGKCSCTGRPCTNPSAPNQNADETNIRLISGAAESQGKRLIDQSDETGGTNSNAPNQNADGTTNPLVIVKTK